MHKSALLYNNHMQKAAFIDLDQTLYKGYVFQEWMEYLLLKGFKKSSLMKLGLKIIFNKISGFDYFKAGKDVSRSIAEMLR